MRKYFSWVLQYVCTAGRAETKWKSANLKSAMQMISLNWLDLRSRARLGASYRPALFARLRSCRLPRVKDDPVYLMLQFMIIVANFLPLFRESTSAHSLLWIPIWIFDLDPSPFLVLGPWQQATFTNICNGFRLIPFYLEKFFTFLFLNTPNSHLSGINRIRIG